MALFTAIIFMVSYIAYHSQVGNIKFAGEGFIRPIYFSILASHIVLAALIIPILISTVVLAAKGRYQQHQRLARWTLAMWIYVSVTGIIVYLMAFHIYRHSSV